jgi:MoaA/NifB/PqqE/SkfB family radical SAM enzyme
VSFDKNFCASPWLHTRINNTGNYEYCRWAVKHDRQSLPNIKDEDPIFWFQNSMSKLRIDMLEGKEIIGCADCRAMEEHGKVSGRQRQLLKIGVNVENFEKTLLSSPWLEIFKQSQEKLGHTDQLPQDWQIDLGNFCNSACLFCEPHASSKLAAEFKKIGFIKKMPPKAWCDDSKLLNLFVDTLEKTPNIAYLHFIGGETLITPAFKVILEKLVKTGLSKKVTVGFTTNLTTWNQDIVDLLLDFDQINLGMSVECFHPLNDYIRYGSDIDTVKNLLQKWLQISRDKKWLTQLRITPTILSIYYLDTIYEFASQHDIAVESCNFINHPAFMRPSVLPPAWRIPAIEKLQHWINKNDYKFTHQVINTRNPSFVKQQIIQDAKSYIEYLNVQPDESHRLKDLVDYLHAMESSRKNSLLDYLPEYEKLLRPAGY